LQDYARPIDEKLVNSFQTRQIIDKFASHKIGEYLSCKIYRGVKVGRFRAMLLKLIASENFPNEIILNKNLTPAVLQELAYHKLNFSAARTYLAAEQLFEGVNISDDLRTGLIKYPHGKNISLTDEKINPADIKDFLTDVQFQLYDLIYSQTVESKIILSGACNDLAIMAAMDNLKVDWADFYSRDMASLLKRKYIAAENSAYKITALGKKVLAALDGFFMKISARTVIIKFRRRLKKLQQARLKKFL
jgi:DNA topoisomerase IA